jgi:signal transduction histidine kinase/DNA-binding NarL/FixJ family response regulator
MLVFGTQMHIVTLAFVCTELVILFYLTIYKLSRPDDKKAILNIWLLLLLLVYNITGGLFPDPKLPGSLYIQEVIAYATGFITPSYFPYYVYRAFDLKKMKFHVYKGVSLCLLVPFIAFSAIYAVTMDLDKANYILIIPVLYAIWVIASLIKALRFKYSGRLSTYEAKEECVGLLISLTPWVGLPVIVFLNLGQALEASVTNTGFLLLLGLHLKNHISQFRKEHDKLVESEVLLRNWNSTLQSEVEKRTKELQTITEQKANTFINLAHETKTPLTLIQNYIDEYSAKRKYSVKTRGTDELSIVRNSISKITRDINNLLDNERFEKGLSIYDHSQITCISEILFDEALLFKKYATKRGVRLECAIEKEIFVKADPTALNRVVNNLIENSIKYSTSGTLINVTLQADGESIAFIVQDQGLGIERELQNKVLEPYFQINHEKKSNQGLGLGLPIVKKVVDSLDGKFTIESDPSIRPGTTVKVELKRHIFQLGEVKTEAPEATGGGEEVSLPEMKNEPHDNGKQTIMVVEDNILMVHYLRLKLRDRYNIDIALNGAEAIQMLEEGNMLPDIIISDIMMDVMDGYTFGQILAADKDLNHIPILFLSARSAKSDRLQGFEVGAIDFIAKPFDLPELEMKITSILARANNQKRVFLASAVRALTEMEVDGGHSESCDLDNKIIKNCDLYSLTARERDIVKHIIRGASYKDIAGSLYISERTVTTHVQNIFDKVRVKRKIDLINRLTG